MRKYLLGLGLMVMFMAGCEEYEILVNSTDICDAKYVNWFSPVESATTLTDEQKKEVKEAHHSACVKYHDGLPACKAEAFEFFKCYHIDNSKEYWDSEDAKEEKCYEDYGHESEEAEKCVDKLFQACRSVSERYGKCMNSHSAVLEEYDANTDYGLHAIEEKLIEFGTTLEELQDAEGH